MIFHVYAWRNAARLLLMHFRNYILQSLQTEIGAIWFHFDIFQLLFYKMNAI